VKAEGNVKGEKAGAVTCFKVAGFEKQLDKNTANKDAKSAMELKVYGVDEKGGQAAQITTGLFYSVKDSTGKEIATGNAASLKIDATSNDYETGKEYTVTVKLGEKAETAYQVFSDKFTVTDTQALPKVSLTKGTVDIDVSKGEGLDPTKLFDVTFTGATKDDITVNDFSFNSDNVNVIKGTVASTAIIGKDGTASLVIKSVDVKVKSTVYTVKLDGEVLKANVKGNAEKAEAAAEAAVVKAETSKLQNDVADAKALVDALPNGATKTSLLERLDVVTAPTISAVSITSSNSDKTKAEIGDTITLTFKSDRPVTKLNSFKIAGGNPASFTDLGNNTYEVTHLVDAGDTEGPVTFQINVQSAAGIYSITVEETTDNSSVEIDLP